MSRILTRMWQRLFFCIYYRKKIKHISTLSEKDFLFKNVFFEVRTRCNGSCSFCPASSLHETRSDNQMSFDVYKKVIDEIAETRFSGRIAYHVHNEPLLFDDLDVFIEYAKRKIPNSWIQIKTNAILLSPKRAKELIARGVNEFSISCYMNRFNDFLPEKIRDLYFVVSDHYKGSLIKGAVNQKKILRQKYINSSYYDNKKALFVFEVTKRRQNEVLSNRSQNAPNKRDSSFKQLFGFCDLPFDDLTIGYDGSVLKCSLDFCYKDVFGNAKDGNVVDIWRSSRLNAIRSSLLKADRRFLSMCSSCDFTGYRDSLGHWGNILVEWLFKRT